MADTRQDGSHFQICFMFAAIIIACLVIGVFAQDSTIRSLRQQLSQGCK